MSTPRCPRQEGGNDKPEGGTLPEVEVVGDDSNHCADDCYTKVASLNISGLATHVDNTALTRSSVRGLVPKASICETNAWIVRARSLYQ